jgi:hypothetical protein
MLRTVLSAMEFLDVGNFNEDLILSGIIPYILYEYLVIIRGHDNERSLSSCKLKFIYQILPR